MQIFVNPVEFAKILQQVVQRRAQTDIFQQGRAKIVRQASDVLHHLLIYSRHLAAFLFELGWSFRSLLAMDRAAT